MEFSAKEQQSLYLLAEQYTPYVRALLGAIMEKMKIDTFDLKSSLNGVTTYKLPISDIILPTKQNWNIL